MTSTIRAPWLAAASLVVACSGTPSAKPGSQAVTVSDCGVSANGARCTLVTSQPDASTTVYQITQPVVNQPSTDYPSVTFQPGDQVTVEAGGCVQTGGFGSTWKRYVNPVGDKSDHLYFGLLTVPGIYSQAPLRTVLSPEAATYGPWRGSFSVPQLQSSDPACAAPLGIMFLKLGYPDDQYDDNGYWGHDDGNDNQCAYSNDGGPAYITFTVRHGVPGPYPAGAAFDLVPGCFDHNFLFLNSRWGWQVPGSTANYDRNAVATTQETSYDSPDWLDDVFGAKFTCSLGGGGGTGHRNWFDVTYTGIAHWDEHSFWDDDYNINLETALVPGTSFVEGGMVDNPSRIHCEFDSDETIDEFTAFPGTFWSDLRAAVDSGDANARALVDGNFTIMVGLMGIDEVHNPNGGNELHPVHVLAIRVASTSTGGYLQERWAIFARNWGDEGWCSDDDHFLLLNDVTLRLPPSDPGVIDASRPPVIGGGLLLTNAADQGANFLYFPSDDPQFRDMFVTFQLPNPEQHGWIAGDVYVDWPQPGAPPTPPAPPHLVQQPKLQVAALPPTRADTMTGGGGGDGIEIVVDAMTPAQQADAFAVYQSILPPKPPVDARQLTPVALSAPPTRPTAVPSVALGPLPARTLAKRKAAVGSVCVATAGQPPTLVANACHRVPPVTLLSTSGGASGKNGWLVSPLTVILTARDASGSGIAYTQDGFDGSTFSPYAGPFTAPEGAITVYYRSADGNGNVEEARQRSFKIDTRPPSSQATSAMGANAVTLTYSVTDPVPGSGPAGLHTVSHPTGGGTVSRFTAGASGTVVLADTTCTAVEFWGEDVAGNEEAPHRFTADQVPPTLSVAPDSLCLWPPNHQRVRFRLGSDVLATATDNCDPSPRVAVVSVTSSEPDDGLGDGDTAGDVGFGPSAFCVRRERSGTGPGRVYTVTVEAKDASGNATRKAVRVLVPHSAQAGCGAAGTVIPDSAPCE